MIFIILYSVLFSLNIFSSIMLCKYYNALFKNISTEGHLADAFGRAYNF